MKSLLSLLVPLSTAAFIPEARLGRPHGLARPVADSQWVHAEMTGDSEGDRKNDEALLAVVPASVNKYEVVMSPAIPFLECPKPLVDCELAGNVGFDPLGLATTKEALLDYREAEVKHGRLAMLAAAGWPISEILDRRIADFFGLDSLLDAYDRAPSVLNGGLERIHPVWWGTCLGLTAAIDLYGVAKARSGDVDYIPGKLGFDPLNVYPVAKAGQQRMELAEIKHGRLAMIAVAAFSLQEYATSIGVVNETPFFFFPLGDSLGRMGLE